MPPGTAISQGDSATHRAEPFLNFSPFAEEKLCSTSCLMHVCAWMCVYVCRHVYVRTHKHTNTQFTCLAFSKC